MAEMSSLQEALSGFGKSYDPERFWPQEEEERSYLKRKTQQSGSELMEMFGSTPPGRLGLGVPIMAGRLLPKFATQMKNVIRGAEGYRDPKVLSHFLDLAKRMPRGFQRGLKGIQPMEKGIEELIQRIAESRQRTVPEAAALVNKYKQGWQGLYDTISKKISLKPQTMHKTTSFHEGLHRYIDSIEEKVKSGQSITKAEQRALDLVKKAGTWMEANPEKTKEMSSNLGGPYGTSFKTYRSGGKWEPEELLAQASGELLASGKHYRTFGEYVEPEIQKMTKELRRLYR
jgi:hypothetical protein